ncbi:MAG TPA: glycosyltransferase family 2 protein [Mesorhizobium sp.]|nr:glycosyltransferase family 2 protein [Mesorhizobium sp.]
MTDVELSIVIPCYNEAAGIETFWSRLTGAVVPLGLAWEAIFVNDGSTDATLEAISRLPAETGAVQIIDFSRNFGKEAAITAGLDHARGAAVIIIDADLQHPPEVIPEMVRLWRQGTEVVLCKRESRDMDSPLRAFLSGLFYKLSSQLFEVKIPRDVGDFRLLDRAVVDALSRLRENQRFMKGLFAWIGFRSETIEFKVEQRAHGASKFHLWKLLNFAVDGITSFTTVPLRLWFYIGMALSLLAIAYGVTIIFSAIFFGNPVPGYPSIVALVTFLGGLQLIGVGILGEYVGRTYKEVKFRPLYVIRKASVKEPNHARPGPDGQELS